MERNMMRHVRLVNEMDNKAMGVGNQGVSTFVRITIDIERGAGVQDDEERSRNA